MHKDRPLPKFVASFNIKANKNSDFRLRLPLVQPDVSNVFESPSDLNWVGCAGLTGRLLVLSVVLFGVHGELSRPRMSARHALRQKGSSGRLGVTIATVSG